MDQGVPSETSLPYTPEVLPGAQAEPYPPAYAQEAEAYEQAYAETAEDPTRGRWFALLRPQTLLFGAGPVLVSLTLLWAQGTPLALLPALCTPLAAILVLAGANMLDEYLDYERYAVRGPVL